MRQSRDEADGLHLSLTTHLPKAAPADLVLGSERGWNSIYWHTRADNALARHLYDRYVPADEFVRYRLAISPQASD